MEIKTSRFGRIEVEPEDIIRFPRGLVGMPDCRLWVFVAEAENDALAWLQSIEQPEKALAVVSPRRFVPGYQLRVTRRELESLRLGRLGDARVLAIVAKGDRSVTLNLKAPLVVHLEHRLGRQVVAIDDLPVRHELDSASEPLRKSA